MTEEMARWVPKNQRLASLLPKGSEDVAFKRTQDGKTIVKAHAAILASQSKELHDKLFPVPEGNISGLELLRSQTISKKVLYDWTHATDCEVALKAFVKILYGTNPTFASLDLKTLMGVHSLASHYNIPELVVELAEKINGAQIPVSEIANYLTFAHKTGWSSAVSQLVAKTLQSVPGTMTQWAHWGQWDLNFLKGHLGKILPTGTDLDALLDAYKKFLALKVCFSCL